MSAPAQDSLPLFCELGWHRPEKLARWNDGYYFSKCTRCGRDLVRTAYGHWQEPRGYRVVWQASPPETRPDIDLVPVPPEKVTVGDRSDGAGASPLANPAGRASEPRPAGRTEIADAHAPEGGASVAAELGETVEGAPNLESTPAALPMVGLMSPALPGTDDLPENGRSAPAAAGLAGPGIGRVPEGAAAAPPPGETEPTSADREQAQRPAAAAEEESSGEEQLPFPDMASAQAASADPNELPILQVIRHLKATPPTVLPAAEEGPTDTETDLRAEADQPAQAAPPPQSEAADGTETFGDDRSAPADAGATETVEDGRSAHGDTGSATETLEEDRSALEDAGGAAETSEENRVVAAEAGGVSETLEYDRHAPADAGDAAETPREDQSTQAEAGGATETLNDHTLAQALPEPVSADMLPDSDAAVSSEPAPADPIPEQAEVAPPRPRKEPVRHYSDFDFMAEEEEDPIGTFWEETSSGEPETAQPARSAPEPLGPHETEPQHAPQPAAEQHSARPIISPDRAAQSSAERSQPEPTGHEAAVLDRTDAGEFSSKRDLSAPNQSKENMLFASPASRAVAPPESAAATSRAAAPPREEGPPASLEDWLAKRERQPEPLAAGSGADRLADQEEPALPAPRVALAALVSVGIVALVIALGARSNVATDVPVPRHEQSTAASETIAPIDGTPAPEPEQRPADGERGTNEAAGPAYPPLAPILPARETAFVTASVLQCRAAPVEGSAPVRKLVRGAEVQILAREGSWTSVAHKGRQCWTAARFLSPLQPW